MSEEVIQASTSNWNNLKKYIRQNGVLFGAGPTPDSRQYQRSMKGIAHGRVVNAVWTEERPTEQIEITLK